MVLGDTEMLADGPTDGESDGLEVAEAGGGDVDTDSVEVCVGDCDTSEGLDDSDGEIGDTDIEVLAESDTVGVSEVDASDGVTLADTEIDDDDEGTDSLTVGDSDMLDVKLRLSDTVGVLDPVLDIVSEIVLVIEIVGVLLSDAVSLGVGVRVASEGVTVAVTVLDAEMDGGSVEGVGHLSKNLAGPENSFPQKLVFAILRERNTTSATHSMKVRDTQRQLTFQTDQGLHPRTRCCPSTVWTVT